MNPQFNLKCPKGNSATGICSSKFCKQSPIFCLEKGCSCGQAHEQCTYKTSYCSKKSLDRKGRSFSPAILEIISWCENKIKQMSVFLEDFKKQINNHESFLIKDQLKMYNLLKEGKSSEVTKQLISSTARSLDDEPEYDLKDKMKLLKENLKKESEELNNILKRVNSKLNILNIEGTQNVQIIEKIDKQLKFFSPTFHHANIEIVNNTTIRASNTTIRAVNSNPSKLALMQPQIEQRPEIQSFRFKILKPDHETNIGFGLCHKNTVINNQYLLKSNPGGGCYLVHASYGQKSSNILQNQNNIQSKIKAILVNEIVQVTYDSIKKLMTITNTWRKQSDTWKIQTEPNNPLHLCVVLYKQNDMVQYLGKTNQ